MQVEVLRAVLIGSKIHQEGDTVDVKPDVGKRLSREPNPAVKILSDETLPMLTRQSLQPAAPAEQPANAPAQQNANPSSAPEELSLQVLVGKGIQPKVAKILLDAGLKSTAELTLERMTAIEGIGEKTAEMVISLLQPAA